MQLLLLDNAAREGSDGLQAAAGQIGSFLPDHVEQVLFVPFAAVSGTGDEYLELVRPVLASLGRTTVGLHAFADQQGAVEAAECVLVGGGNAWELLRRVRQRGLLQALADRARAGVPYIGWGAGAILACPTIMTTGDLPLAHPGSFAALDLVPFQIGFDGRDRQLVDFCAMHRSVSVAELGGGAAVHVDDDRVHLLGGSCRAFRWGSEPVEVEPGGDLVFLADRRVEHDSLGEREVPHHAYYGVQTVRAVENFPLSGITLSMFPALITAFAHVKKAAAIANGELGELPAERRDAIVAACDEIAAGELHDHFVVDMFQGGAGTSTNMNVNEVITNRGLELLGQRRGRLPPPAPERPRRTARSRPTTPTRRPSNSPS